MTSSLQRVEALLDDLWLDAERLCRLAGVTETWLHERADLGLLAVRRPGPGEAWRFDVADLKRVQRMAGLERDFDAVPELAALVADLEDELRALRAQLHRRLGP